MATIKDVAEKAGVSAATVSYVLNDSCKVRPATEQRVLRAAKELGYMPNTAARSQPMRSTLCRSFFGAGILLTSVFHCLSY